VLTKYFYDYNYLLYNFYKSFKRVLNLLKIVKFKKNFKKNEMGAVSMKNKKLFYYALPVLLLMLIGTFLFLLPGCGNSNKNSYGATRQQDKTSKGVISLLDSYGVGDVESYPGAEYDRALNDMLGEYRNQLNIPGEFINVLFTVYTTGDKPAEVISFYNSKMEELQWQKYSDETSTEGGCLVWKKASNRGTDISYIVITGQINYNNKDAFVILTGLIIPGYGEEDENYPGTTEEGSEIGPGQVFFENPQPPEGQGLLPTDSLSMGISQWQQWLQAGSKVAGENKVSAADDPMFIKIVEFSRKADGRDGGAAGIYQALDIDTKAFSKINIWLVGKIKREEGGSLAGINEGFPEGAVQVRLKYTAADGSQKEWYHGFFYSNIIYYDKLHFSLVTKDKWFWYISPDLLELKDKPLKIDEIRIYGFGWQFNSQVADVNIIGY